MIELGVPFSDPMADGPVIQKAGERALARGIGMAQVLGCRARRSASATPRTPVVLMGYANPIERYEQRRAGASSRDASEAGVDGVLVVDYPPEECEAFAARAAGRRAGPDLPARADLDRAAHASRSAASPAATSTTCR